MNLDDTHTAPLEEIYEGILTIQYVKNCTSDICFLMIILNTFKRWFLVPNSILKHAVAHPVHCTFNKKMYNN